MKLSVIMPCLNGATTIVHQLEALAQQTWSEPWELIVADNGSTDQTVRLVQQYSARLPQLRLVDASGRRGPAHARNVGIQAAQGELLVFCDADDEVAPGWLAAMGQALERHPFVTCYVDDAKLNPSWMQGVWNPVAPNYKILGFLPAAGGCSIGFHRALYERVGAFDEELPRMEDIDYCWRAQIDGQTLRFLADAVVHYRYRTELGRVYRVACLDGRCHVRLYKKFAARGMRWRSAPEALHAWLQLLRERRYVRSRGELMRWTHRLGVQVGQMQGSIEQGVVAL